MPAKGNKHYGYLLDDPQVNRWYENVARGSRITAAVPSIARYASPGLILVGGIFTIVAGVRGIPLLLIGLGYLILPSIWRVAPERRTLYAPLVSGALVVFIGALGLYAAIGVSPSDIEITGYYSLIATSFALFLAGIADLSLQLTRSSLEKRIVELGKQIEDYRDEDHERWDEEE